MEQNNEAAGRAGLDVLIAGAGYVGLATAVSIKQARPSLAVAVVDAAPEGAWRRDGRASAIAAAACRMLERLGVWDELAPEAQAITDMVITDSRAADPVRPTFLTFDGEVAPGEPFAHMVANRDLNGALRRRAEKLGIDLIEGMAVLGFDIGAGSVTVHLADGATLEARLLVAADGVKSRLRDMAGIKTVRWEYGQSGIVCTVGHERPHNGRAEEHFLPAGPFATLPLKPAEDGTNRSSIVWVERTEDAGKLVSGDDLVFEIELEQRFGLKLGEIRVADTPRAVSRRYVRMWLDSFPGGSRKRVVHELPGRRFACRTSPIQSNSSAKPKKENRNAITRRP